MEDSLKHLKALADPTRLRIMLLLLEEELCVCELESILDMEQSRISHALRTLREAELIEERREGRWIFYRKSSELSQALLAYLEESFGNENAAADRRRARQLLESSMPSGKRCPLRNR